MGEFALLALASYRLTRLLLRDSLLAPVREWVWERRPPESTRTGYLLTCPWCLGFWVSSGVWFCYTIAPVPALWVCCVLALSAVVGLLTAFEDRF